MLKFLEKLRNYDKLAKENKELKEKLSEVINNHSNFQNELDKKLNTLNERVKDNVSLIETLNKDIKSISEERDEFKDCWLSEKENAEKYKSKYFSLDREHDALKEKLFIEENYRGKDYFTNKSGNLRFFNLREIDFRQDYDCEWAFTVFEGEQEREYFLTFRTGSHKDTTGVMKKLISCENLNDISKLDQRNDIYYD